MRLVTEGRNRFVVVTARYAVKFPSLRSWRDFRYGLANNRNEARVHATHPAYCPVLWHDRFGLVVVMPRVDILRPDGFDPGVLPRLPGAERKPSSWGYLAGRLVAVDYGWQE